MLIGAGDPRRLEIEWPRGYPCLRVGDRVYIRASSLGRCMVGMVGVLLEYEPTPPRDQTQRWWDEGKLHEPDIIGKLKKAEPNWVIVDSDQRMNAEPVQFQVQVDVPNTPITIVGHIDGMVAAGQWWSASNQQTYELEDLVIEAKSVGDWTWREKVMKLGISGWVKRFMPYAYQFTTYVVGASNVTEDELGDTDFLGGVYAVKDRNMGRFAYEVIPLPLAPDAPIWRAQEVWKWVEQGVLPPCDGKCTSYDSAWWHIHERPTSSPEPMKQTDPAVSEAVKRYKELGKAEKEIAKEKDDIKKKLGEGLGVGAWTTESGTVRVYGEGDEAKKVRRFSQDKAREFLSEEAFEECHEVKEYPGAIDIR